MPRQSELKKTYRWWRLMWQEKSFPTFFQQIIISIVLFCHTLTFKIVCLLETHFQSSFLWLVFFFLLNVAAYPESWSWAHLLKSGQQDIPCHGVVCQTWQANRMSGQAQKDVAVEVMLCSGLPMLRSETVKKSGRKVRSYKAWQFL